MPLLRKYTAHGQDERTVLLGALCPACKYEHAFRVDADYWTTQLSKAPWTFNGDFESPTFSPSMLAAASNPKHRCHSFLRNGVWEFLDDCGHDMAGQKVPMIPIKETPHADA